MKIEIRTVNTVRNTTNSLTGMHMQEWMKEVNIKISSSTEEENDNKMECIGSQRRAIDREMMRLMGLIK
jgi:uncharacterized membrane protein (DUF106 family)